MTHDTTPAAVHSPVDLFLVWLHDMLGRPNRTASEITLLSEVRSKFYEAFAIAAEEQGNDVHATKPLEITARHQALMRIRNGFEKWAKASIQLAEEKKFECKQNGRYDLKGEFTAEIYALEDAMKEMEALVVGEMGRE